MKGTEDYNEEEIEFLKDLYLIRKKEREEKNKKINSLIKYPTSEKHQAHINSKSKMIETFYALDYWQECFSKVSFHNEILGQCLFHVAIGQALRNKNIYFEDGSQVDYRINVLSIQDSGSGKSKSLGFLTEVMLKIQPKIKIHKLGRMNPASLINTYAIDRKGNIVIDENGIEQVKFGILEEFDFIYSEEGRSILDYSKEAFELQEMFMTAIETIGSKSNIYTKTLTNYIVPCETTSRASFVIVSRPFGKIKQTLIESGLMQRFIFYPRELKYSDRQEMNKIQSFSFRNRNKQTDFSQKFNILIENMNSIIQFANENVIDFNEKNIDEILSFLYEKIMFFTNDIEFKILHKDIKYIMQSFVSRYKDNMIKIAFHSAIMRKSKYVEKEDLQYAFNLFKKIYDSQKIWININVEENTKYIKEELEIKKLIKKILSSKSLSYNELISELSTHSYKDEIVCQYILDKFIQKEKSFISYDMLNRTVSLN